ncbi:sensor histidine kinase [Paenibacillus sp. sgz302251]|uniref:sensor histidine kinase n=1 Tax=Paenibacillus sp. sgz302251 TaxID=3414493 RepID=UPI003C7B25EB
MLIKKTVDYFSFLQRWSLKKKLIVFYLLFLVIPMLLMNFVSYLYSTRLVQKQVTDSHAVLSGQISDLIEDHLKDIEKISSSVYSPNLLEVVTRGKYVGDNPIYVKDNREMNRFFSYIVNDIDELDGVYVFTANGNSFYKSVIDQMKAVFEPQNEQWYRNSELHIGKSVISGVHQPWALQLSSERYVFSVVKTIRGISGDRICTILLDLKLDSIGNIVEKYQRQYDSRILVLDETNRVLLGDELFKTGALFDERAVLDPIQSGHTHANIILEGKSKFLTYEVSDVSGWKVISITEKSIINKEMDQLRNVNILVTFSFSILSLGFLLTIYFTNYKPIFRLRRSMKQVEIGDFSARADLPATDEIGSLGKSFNNMLDKINDLIESEYKADLRKKEAEFMALQAQINPHFLYNTLQLISSMSVVNGVREIDQISQSLAAMFRYTIETTGDTTTVANELEHVRHYLYIQTLRLNGNFEVTTDIDAGAERCSIVKLTLQPFVENIFKHGFRHMNEKGMIRLIIKRQRNRLVIKIIDNGCGMDSGTLQKLKRRLYENAPDVKKGHSSIGIHNVDSRLKHCYGGKYHIFFKSIAGIGTKILIVLPILYHER